MKKTIYILLFTFLGLMMSFLAHASIEIVYIKYALGKGIVLANHPLFGHGYCTLPVWLQVGLLAAGLTGGFWLGVIWWRIIYIEKRFAPKENAIK